MPEQYAASGRERKLELSRPLAILDIQSTGLDTETARIVKISVLKIDPDGTEHVKSVVVNPGLPIPPGASQVHGIVDLDVMDRPVFRSYARALSDHLEGCDLAGFGIERFGLPLLIAEFARNGVVFTVSGRAIVDAMTVFHRLEPRNLASAFARFVGVKRPESSDEAQAARDVLEILRGEVSSSTDVPVAPAEIADWAKGIDSGSIDSDGRFRWSEDGDALVNFGKHRGERLVEVVSSDPEYLRWIAGSDNFGPEVRKIAEAASTGYLPERDSSAESEFSPDTGS
ncbi:MAG: exonuclease domain-containing protein [Chloroflexi bacterium]|nr:exonuclease domain-containing protein [Chloroflexota bacterium]